MSFDVIRKELAIGEDEENGIELILRFCESLRLKEFDKQQADQLEKLALKIERFFQKRDESLGESKLNIEGQLILKRLGKSLLEVSTDIFRKEIPLKQLINFLACFEFVLNKSKKDLDEEKIKSNLKYFDLSRDEKEVKKNIEEQFVKEEENPDKESTLIKKLKVKLKESDSKDPNDFIIRLSAQMGQFFTMPMMAGSFNKMIFNGVFNFDIHKIKNRNFEDLSLFISNDKIKQFKFSLPFPEYSQRYGVLLWEMDLIVKNERNLTKIGYLLWSLGTTLDSINGVKTEITDIGEGSIWTRIRIFFKDLVAKEETKEVLQKTRDALESQYLDKPIEELKKIESEKEKTQAEAEILKQKALEMKSEDTSEMKKLEIESKRIENKLKIAELESKELENKGKKIELIEKLSNLAASGIIPIDDLQININEVLYLDKEEGRFLPGQTVNEIEKGKQGLEDIEESN